MPTFRRTVTALSVTLLLCVAVAPRVSADDGNGGGGKSLWDRVTDTGGKVVDKVWPGDSVQDKVKSVVTGQSLLSPGPNIPKVIQGSKDVTVAGAKSVGNGVDQAGRLVSPSYAKASDAVGTASQGMNGIVGKVPGGWRTVGAGGLVLILLILWKLLVPPAVSAGKTYVTGGVAAKVPSSLGGAKPAKPRPPRTQTRHRPVAAAKATWGHSGQYGKADVISADRTRLVFCADSEDHAMNSARKRWQGWRVRTVFCVPCDVNPDKVHAHVKKTTATKAKR